MEYTSQDITDLYCSGMTITQISEHTGIKRGSVYLKLLRNNCSFRSSGHPIGYTMPEETRRKIGDAHRGKTVTAEQRKHISDGHRCNYDGLNGYGHTKNHNGGYVLAYAPMHPRAHRDGYIMLHTVIMERYIGRYLENDECVHHINHNRKDNDISNLQLMKKHDHFSMHTRERNEERRRSLRTN